MSAYDVYDTGSTVLDSCASDREKGTAVALFAAGAILPGSFGWLDDVGEIASKGGAGLLDKITLSKAT